MVSEFQAQLATDGAAGFRVGHAVVDRLELQGCEQAAVERRKIFDGCRECIGRLGFGVGRQDGEVVVEIQLERTVGNPGELRGERATAVGVPAERVTGAALTTITPLK